MAVFVPLAFLTDSTGRLFREFAVTVAAAIAISGFVAVTLSPALCARVLRHRPAEGGLKRFLAREIERLSDAYGRALRPVLKRPLPWVAFGLAWFGAGALLYLGIDEELIPESDRGVVLVFTRAPEGSTVEYMERYQRQAEAVMLDTPEVDRVFSVVARGFGAPGLVNEGILIAMLKPENERSAGVEELTDQISDRMDLIPGIVAYTINPSPMRGFLSAPVEVVIQGDDIRELAAVSERVKDLAEESGGFADVRGNLFLNKPQLEVSIDRNRAADLGVSVREAATTMQILLGGLDISTFKLGGETYNVMAQLERANRTNPRDLLELYVRGRDRGLIPMASFVEVRETVAPRGLPHYDRQRSVRLSARLEGLAQGPAIRQMRAFAQEALPGSGYQVRFVGDSEKFIESSNALLFAYVLAIVVVYLVLAAQFESFVHPVTILVAALFAFTGALIALKTAGDTLNLYSKIGMVMLVGLVTKNSILIVEFANQLRGRGLELVEATFQAARTRFRPILMTAIATMVGILPLALGLGAGGQSRAPLGVAVMGGMLFSTALTFFLVPATYIAIERARAWMWGGDPERAEPPDYAAQRETVSAAVSLRS